jgi:hypothetical protein
MDMGELGPQPTGYRELMQQAREILIQEQAFSTDEAHRYLYELAQAGNLFVSEVASRIVAGEWAWTEVSPELTSADAGKWLGRW